MLDRISNLPDDVTEKIVSRLPLREATRTSVLSTKWRYKSAMLQDLVFDKGCLSTDKSYTTLVNVVDHVLLLHVGPLRKFELICFKGFLARTHTDIDRWLNHLSRNSIKQLILDASALDIAYIIPSCLFSCQDMVRLELYGCLLYPPSTFRGFRALKYLKICDLYLSQVAVNNLICCSPLLEGLTMRNCLFSNLKIDAPNLRYIDILGDCKDFEVVNTSNLADASIDLGIKVNQIRGLKSTSNLVKVLNQLPHIQRLTIKRKFLKYLSIGIGALPQKLSKPCQYLSVLSFHINFNDVNEVSTAICLLLSSPALQQLEVSGREKIKGAVVEKLETSYSFWDLKMKACLDDNYKFNLNQLRLVTITKISGVQAELDIIQFLLSTSPVLERMTIKPSVNCSSKLVKDLLRLRRLSICAEIIYLDP